MTNKMFEVTSKEVSRQEREITCVCGESIPIDLRKVLRDDIPSGWTYCEECGRLYAPEDEDRTRYKLLGFPCVWCDSLVPKLYYQNRDDKEPECCEKCLRKSIEDIPDEISVLQDRLSYAKQQLKEGE